ncbi:hypothetical protein NDU88_003471 [Pleurodeles waltl]|uniref:Uncharacterized protein n=1 Tax=Pleurodeles waltl TaxID=8319 RepID=A0AAV7V055_PLEWA|nr:hypothetical protein NDU88_003471 [Pleurodeles waltl]
MGDMLVPGAALASPDSEGASVRCLADYWVAYFPQWNRKNKNTGANKKVSCGLLGRLLSPVEPEKQEHRSKQKGKWRCGALALF